MWLSLGCTLLAAACGSPRSTITTPESSGSAGLGTGLVIHGQAVAAHPWSHQDVLDRVKRRATARCPGGYVIRRVVTDAPPPGDLFGGSLRTYQAVIDCEGLAGGAR